MSGPFHELNWYFGWILVMCAFISGAGLGLFFHNDTFWGGYNSFRRRIVRLGHIALAALGMMNVIYSLSPWPQPGTSTAIVATWGLLIGGLTMPAICFLTGWRSASRHLFFVPVVSLVTAVIAILVGAVR